jgi:hypothetical protein
MAMPTGDSPQDVQDYYEYLQGHHITDGRVETWHVDWFAVAWLWGFVAVMTIAILYWVKQYRTTRQRPGIYPMDAFGGWTSEGAGPATAFFIVFTLFIVAFDAAIIIGHLVWGQRF